MYFIINNNLTILRCLHQILNNNLQHIYTYTLYIHRQVNTAYINLYSLLRFQLFLYYSANYRTY